ncbi:MAG: hypothetical protein IKR19_08795 [Acholeplasmatales bacterium]|nr:hypothetical protein [Acholeplasmatales bacterium]
MKIIDLEYDEEKKSAVYNGISYPNCKMVEDLDLYYTGFSETAEINDENLITNTGRKSKAKTTYNNYSFLSNNIPNTMLLYKISSKINNKFRVSLDAHRDIRGVKYKIKAIIEFLFEEPDDAINIVIKIHRVIKFEQITRNPESCK